MENVYKFIGPPGCLHGDTEIFDPVAMESVRVADRRSPFHVWAMSEHGPVVALAETPWMYEPAEMTKLTFSNDQSITVTLGHRFLDGQTCEHLLQSGEAHLQSISDACLLVQTRDALHSIRKAEDFLGYCSVDCRPCGEQLPHEELACRLSARQQTGARPRSRGLLHGRAWACTDTSNHREEFFLHSNRGCIGQSGQCPAAEFAPQLVANNDELLACLFSFAEQPYQWEGQWSTAEAFLLGDPVTTRPAYLLPPLNINRRSDQYNQVVRLVKVESAGVGPYYDFHVPFFENYWACGLWHHNTGKTHTLSLSVVKNATEYGASNIVCCSLTKAAAAVLASRIDLPKKNIGTLHSFAFRALGLKTDQMADGQEKDFGLFCPDLVLSGGGTEGGKSKGKKVKESDLDQIVDEFKPSKTYGDRLRAEMDILRARRIPLSDQRWNNCRLFYEKWAAWKAENDLLDFTDLLEQCLLTIDACPGDPAVIIADEAQDFSHLAIDLLLKWGARTKKLILAGDANQNLYEWAGAEAAAFIGVATNPKHRHPINQSWRVPRAVHRLATSIEAKIKVKEDAPWLPRDFEGETRRINETPAEATTIVAEAIAHADAGNTVMILASCSYMLTPVLTILKSQCVPFHNAYRAWRKDWNPLARGGNKKPGIINRLLAYLKPSPQVTIASPDDEYASQPTWTRNDLSLWMEMLEADGNIHDGQKQRVKELRGDDAEATFDDFTSIFTTDAIKRLAILDMHEPACDLRAALQSLRQACLPGWQKKIEYACRIAESRGVAALRDTPRITVGTVHSVKGGEAQHVYLFNDISKAGYAQWLGGGEARDPILRLFYVAVTRASETLTMCGSRSRGVQLL